jgi:ubiquinone biosynthesis protein
VNAIAGALQSVTTAVGLVLDILILAWATRRLLGIRLSLTRTVLAGALAWAILDPLLTAMIGRPTETNVPVLILFAALAICCALLGAMVFLVLAEVFVPSGSLPTPLEWRRGLGGWLARTGRYLQVSRILVRHGLSGYLNGRWRADLGSADKRRRLARSLREALDACGVTFIKLGQVLATRSDLLPPEFVEELRSLQDHAAGIAWADVERVLTEELGGVDGVFAEIERTPLAAASIAQVHAARLHSGEVVVVKVQRPGVQVLVARDLDILRQLGRRLQRSSGWGRSLGAEDLATGFAQALREELDFRVEAGNMTAVAAAAAARSGGPEVRVPTAHEQLCTRRVLVMERLAGVSIATAAPTLSERGIDGEELARTLLECLLRQILIDGVFHADPHSGNILVLEDGTLGLLDFGSVGRLDAALRRNLQQLLLAINGGDAVAVSDALLMVVDAPEELDEPRLERALGSFIAQHLGPGRPAGIHMFTDLFRIVTAHGLSVPPQVAAVFRAMATAEGVLALLAPGFDMVGEAREFGGRQLAEKLAPEAVERSAMEQLAMLLPSLQRLPRRLDRISASLETGRLGVNVRLLADGPTRQVVGGWLHQILLTLLSATAGIMAVLLLGLSGGPRITAAVSLYQFFGYCLLIICAVLALRVLVVIFQVSRN